MILILLRAIQVREIERANDCITFGQTIDTAIDFGNLADCVRAGHNFFFHGERILRSCAGDITKIQSHGLDSDQDFILVYLADVFLNLGDNFTGFCNVKRNTFWDTISFNISR